jgi:transposase-like protein
MRRLLRGHGRGPGAPVTDRLGSCAAAARQPGLAAEHVRPGSGNDRVEGPHVPLRLRERKMQGLRRPGSARRVFLAVHAAVADAFATSRHPVSAGSHRAPRAGAFAAWREAARAAARAGRAATSHRDPTSST